MDEAGVRHRFQVRFLGPEPTRHAEAMERLLHWCAAFDREGLAPIEGGASAGNLSFRAGGGFVITPTRSRLKAGLRWNHLVEVVRADAESFTVEVRGEAPPSSDSFLHERIYAARPDVHAVFHGHDPLVLARAAELARELPIALTSEARDFGTIEDARETAEELGRLSYVIRLGHGFVATGTTMEDAGNLALRVHRRALALG